jgi:hypothetical protein
VQCLVAATWNIGQEDTTIQALEQVVSSCKDIITAAHKFLQGQASQTRVNNTSDWLSADAILLKTIIKTKESKKIRQPSSAARSGMS